MVGKNIGHYRVVAKLGEGGMGAVYEAADERINKRAAIKILHPDHAKNPQIATRFINEARAINEVAHPGVVQVSDYGHLPDGTAYIVMELLKGETLNARLKAQGGRLPMLDALRLARQLASALAAAHDKGIIHRDLKPDNVMLVPDQAMPGGERTKLLDFGIAKLRLEYQGSDQVMTRAGMMMGTPLYMAPEQCRNAADVNDRADVYSLGVILYRMLAGRPPFNAPGTGELMAMHIYMQPPPLQDFEPLLPEPLVQLVHRMLAKNRDERPAMAQVAQELDRIGSKASSVGLPAVPGPTAPAASTPTPLTSNAEQATVVSDHNPAATRPLSRPSPSPPPPPPARRLLVLLAAAGATLLVLLGGLSIYRLATRGKPPRNNPPPIVTPPTSPAADDEAAQKKTVDWRIDSDPAGATVVRLDTGEVLGQTPLRSNQPARPGLVKLELRLPNYKPYPLSLNASKDEKPPSVKLEPLRKRPRKGKKG